MKKIFISLFFPALLVGCAGPKITAEDVQLEVARATVASSEAERERVAHVEEMNAISRLDKTQQGMALMGKQMKDMALAFIGKGKQQMGFYDMKASVASQQNALVDKLSGRVLKASVTGGAIWAASDVIKHGQDKIGDTINATGENSQVEVNRISSKSRTDTNQLGDGNSTGAVDASTTGPDKSTTTTEVVAPEEPVVEEEEPEVEEPEGEAAEEVEVSDPEEVE